MKVKMNDFQRVTIALILGIGVSLGLRWLVMQMGYTETQINGAGGIGIITAGVVTIIVFLKITQKDEEK